MPTSEARIKANQANALRSTGPRTQAGKGQSRLNACTHRLTAVVALDDEDAIEVERRTEALTREMAPETELGAILVRKIAVTSVVSERATRQEFFASAERVRHAAERFDEARRDRAGAILDALHEDPRGNLRRLRAMPEGVELLIGAWRDLRSSLARPEKPVWTAAELVKGANLLGFRDDDARGSRLGDLSRGVWGDFGGLTEAEGGDLEEGRRQAWSRARVVDLIDRSIAELEEHARTLDADLIAIDRAEAGGSRAVRRLEGRDAPEAVRVGGVSRLLQGDQGVPRSRGRGRRATGRPTDARNPPAGALAVGFVPGRRPRRRALADRDGPGAPPAGLEGGPGAGPARSGRRRQPGGLPAGSPEGGLRRLSGPEGTISGDLARESVRSDAPGARRE